MTSVIYFVQRESDKAVKIGTTRKLETRLPNLARRHGDLRLLGVISGSRVREKVLHWCFSSDRLDGEFFRPTEELLNLIGEYAYIPDSAEVMIICPKNPQTQADSDSTGGIRITPKPIIDRFGRASQEEIAEAVGVTRPTVAAWLNGRIKVVELDILDRFAIACGVEPGKFFVMDDCDKQ